MRIKIFKGRAGRPGVSEQGRIPQNKIFAVRGLADYGLGWGIMANALQGVDYKIMRAAGAPPGSGRRGCWVKNQQLGSVLRDRRQLMEMTLFARNYTMLMNVVVGADTKPPQQGHRNDFLVDAEVLLAAWEMTYANDPELRINATHGWMIARALHLKQIGWHQCGRCYFEHLAVRRGHRHDDPATYELRSLECPCCTLMEEIAVLKLRAQRKPRKRKKKQKSLRAPIPYPDSTVQSDLGVGGESAPVLGAAAQPSTRPSAECARQSPLTSPCLA